MDPVKIADAFSKTNTLENLPPALQTAFFLSVLGFLPALLVSLTAFTRIVIVLSFVRRAVTTQEIPPNTVIIGLALFLTLFVMGPTWEEINTKALTPYLENKVQGVGALRSGVAVMQKFLIRQTRKQDLALFIHLAGIEPAPQSPEDTPFYVLVPAFMISELKTAFIMGFCIYMPFLLVDLVVASVLTAMGMLMMPPVVISAPFKLLLFVVADGWHLVIRALSLSFG